VKRLLAETETLLRSAPREGQAQTVPVEPQGPEADRSGDRMW